MEIIVVLIVLLSIIWMIKRFEDALIRNKEAAKIDDFNAMIQAVLDDDERIKIARRETSRRNAYLGK